ncbi:MAG: hypothetical protein ACP5G0_07015 [Desulfomonilia bacterium]
MSIYEVTMLVCFGSAWPASIYKSYTSRTSRGKSILFLCIVFIGYVAGVFHKVFYNLDWVVFLYALNGFMILIDMLLYLRNMALDRKLVV